MFGISISAGHTRQPPNPYASPHMSNSIQLRTPNVKRCQLGYFHHYSQQELTFPPVGATGKNRSESQNSRPAWYKNSRYENTVRLYTPCASTYCKVTKVVI